MKRKILRDFCKTCKNYMEGPFPPNDNFYLYRCKAMEDEGEESVYRGDDPIYMYLVENMVDRRCFKQYCHRWDEMLTIVDLEEL